MSLTALDNIEFLALYNHSSPIRHWEQARVYRYCLIVPTEIGHQFGVVVLDPAGFELFLQGCYGCTFPGTADALTAACRGVDRHIVECLQDV
ncbi:hypothetical protein [Prochlorothrix hollandica]|uniref:Uncharacterized protein n=1 Tax=Prochlorothrix hollandica PCC 9006 = CALU 1027 TaxID=317619 RepID=A0A0M2PU36_PROHO|nr:hypothetical protein [Prochlorothrix hollandica]KKJ00046.1 hypothetical protein PROH_09790 [Prochlorothrix hollandica PCC 9006 = CALU 1027]